MPAIVRILAIVPARAGSKRLPGKNTRLLAGRPLITWTIAAAKAAGTFCDILVSTDAPDIAQLARDAGALAPWLRSAELSTDEASSVDVALDALDRYEQTNGAVDAVALLQPTSPFRRAETIVRGCDLFRTGDSASVLAVSPAASHPYWCLRVEHGRLAPFIDDSALSVRSQDLPPAFVVNGLLYIVSTEVLRRTRSFYQRGAIPLVIEDNRETIDIDTPDDWAAAERAVGVGEGSA